MAQNKLFSGPVWLVPWITHMLAWKFKRMFFLCQKSQILSANKKVKQSFYVRLLSELHRLSCTVYITNIKMAVTVAQFISFLQNEAKLIKRGKNQHKHGHFESCRLANRVSWFCVVFLNVFSKSHFSSCVIECDSLDLQKYRLHWQTSHLRFTIQSKRDQKITCLFPLITNHIFSEIRSHGIHRKGRVLAMLTLNPLRNIRKQWN